MFDDELDTTSLRVPDTAMVHGQQKVQQILEVLAAGSNKHNDEERRKPLAKSAQTLKLVILGCKL